MGRRAYSNRLTVEGCESISTKLLNEYHCFEGGVQRGRLSWSCDGKETGSIGFTISTVEGDEHIAFKYTHTDRTMDKQTEFDYKVRLTWSRCFYGGRRWYFICECGHRVGILYLNNNYFQCRHCCDLIYQSSKESHKYDRVAKAMGTTEKRLRQLFKESRTR